MNLSKKFRLIWVSTIFSLTALTALTALPPAALATSQEITLTAPSHRLITGEFIDDALAFEISAVGSLGKPLFSQQRAQSSQTVWRIDPALVEDIQAMARGYKLIDGTDGLGKDFAQAWIDRLKTVTLNSRVIAIAYGNPSGYWVKKLTPHEQNSILASSQLKLSEKLDRPVELAAGYTNNTYFALPSYVVQYLRSGYKTIQGSALYLDPLELDSYRLAIIKMFNQKLKIADRAQLVYDFNQTIGKISQNIRTAPGRFTITSAKQSLPITLINDFPNGAKVNLIIHSTNERMSVSDINNISISGKSKVQVLVPIQVLTSGESGFEITIESPNGVVIGATTQYPINLKVISPVATWITTGAAITLFFAVLLQSFRRLRRKHQNE